MAESPLPEVAMKSFGSSLKRRDDEKWLKEPTVQDKVHSQHKVAEQACSANQPVHQTPGIGS